MRRGLTELFLPGLMTGMAGPALAQRSEEGINQIRRISGRYHSLAQAASDGFAATDGCVAEPELGGMGFHNVNGARIDTTLDVNDPRPFSTHRPKKESAGSWPWSTWSWTPTKT